MFHQLPKQTVPQAKKEKSIQYIVSQTTLAPQTLTQFVYQFYQQFGLGFIFQGIGDVLAAVTLLIFGVFFVLSPGEMLSVNVSVQSYFIAFAIAPLSFGLLYFLSIWKEILVGTFELKQTLRVSLRELMIMRILVFSVIAMFFAVLSNVVLWLSLKQSISLLQLMSVSFVSLLIFTSGQLLLELNLALKPFYYLGPLLWFVTSGVLYFYQGQIGWFLQELPLYVTLVFVLGGLGAYGWLLKKMYATKKEGGLVYART